VFSYSCVSITSKQTYQSHGHTTIRKQTHTEVMDTQLYENKHISKSWTHNYTKTNIYRSHGHTTKRKQKHNEDIDTQQYENFVFA
jgi:hypothetical protein